MEEWNIFLKNIGDPLIIAGTVLGVCLFIFKQKKPKLAIGAFFGGVTIYYVAHNTVVVFDLFSPAIKAILGWLSRAFTG